ncbi:MAG: membrane protein insertase YidC [Paraprevotella sp.]|nr:membrane protein insertase YidC [Paraprevotella sp.]
MDKNTRIGFVLIAAVLIGFSYFSRPSEAEKEAQHRQDSIEAVAYRKAQEAQKLKEDEEVAKQAETALDTTSLFYANRRGEAQQIVLENELIRLTFNTRGGTVRKVELKKYKNQQGAPVTLFDDNDARLQFLWTGKAENFYSGDFFFTSTNVTDSTVTMHLQTASGGGLDLNYVLRPHSYMVDLSIQAQGIGNFFAPSLKTLDIEWNEKARQQEKGFDFETRYATLTYKIKNEGTDYLNATSAKQEKVEDPLDWIAFKNQFFSCVLIAHQDFTNTDLSSTPQLKGSGYLKDYSASMKTFFDPSGKEPTKMQMLFAPNNYHLLQRTNKLSSSNKDLELEDLVYLGWPLFKWINRFVIIYIFDWLSSLGLSMGVVLLLLTILVKLLVYPTTRKSYLSSAKMRVLKPKIDELNAKYPKSEDSMKKQQETMQLYGQYGVSPMGGCLPMLVQMPIWIALFNFVPNAIELRGQSFLWASDLSSYDDVIHWGKSVWLIGDHLSIFCLLFCLTNIVNTLITMRQQQNSMSGEQAQQMKLMQYMMYVMPIFFFFMFNNYSSGLNYYYFLSGLTSILITWYLRKTTDDKKLLAKLEAHYQAYKANPNKKMSGMAARLEALQKQQQAMLEEQKKKQAQNKK